MEDDGGGDGAAVAFAGGPVGLRGGGGDGGGGSRDSPGTGLSASLANGSPAAGLFRSDLQDE